MKIKLYYLFVVLLLICSVNILHSKVQGMYFGGNLSLLQNDERQYDYSAGGIGLRAVLNIPSDSTSSFYLSLGLNSWSNTYKDNSLTAYHFTQIPFYLGKTFYSGNFNKLTPFYNMGFLFAYSFLESTVNDGMKPITTSSKNWDFGVYAGVGVSIPLAENIYLKPEVRLESLFFHFTKFFGEVTTGIELKL